MILTIRHYGLGFFIVLLLLFALGGCQSASSMAGLEEKEGVYLIQKVHDSGQWSTVIEFADVFRTRYPYSADMPQVDLLQADAYFQNGNFAEAVVAYSDFIRKNPTRSEAMLARYRIAESYDKQSSEDIDKDQSSTKQAVEAYTLFVKAYPRSPWASEATQRMEILSHRVLEHNMFIAYFYWEKGLYAAALPRYLDVVGNSAYAQTAPAIYQQARTQAADCYKELAKELEKDPGSQEYAVFLNETPASLREKGARL